jgi:hypothetical protein
MNEILLLNSENFTIPYKVYCKNLQDVKNRFPTYKEICKVGGNFNMLFLKNNQFAAVCNDGNFYIITY